MEGLQRRDLRFLIGFGQGAGPFTPKWARDAGGASCTLSEPDPWCVSHGDLRFLGSRTSLGGYTHDPTHMTPRV